MTLFHIQVEIRAPSCLAGVYVAIPQLEPLTAYVFTGSVLLRFCSKPYVRDITADTDRST
jgi:hypothetical protein